VLQAELDCYKGKDWLHLEVFGCDCSYGTHENLQSATLDKLKNYLNSPAYFSRKHYSSAWFWKMYNQIFVSCMKMIFPSYQN